MYEYEQIYSDLGWTAWYGYIHKVNAVWITRASQTKWIDVLVKTDMH